MPEHHTHRGFATAEGTERFRARAAGAAPDFFASARDLRISTVGLGTYLGASDDPTDEDYVDAIKTALSHGCNHIDTAVNYRCQRSERAIGEALEQVLHAKQVKRDEVFVATKGGYVPFDGTPPRDARAWVKAAIVGKGLAREEEIVAGCHCLAPSYLKAMLSTSLANLRLDTVDLYYLHNPEQQLEEVPRAVFIERLRAAFAALEAEAAAGRIRYYGTATWTGYRVPPEHSDHLGLEELLSLAREVGGTEHRFRYIQLPYNLGMKEAARESTQRLGARRVPILEAARELGIQVSCSASILQGRFARSLPARVTEKLGLDTDAQRAIQFVRSTPGVMSALVGMSRSEHAEGNLGLRRVPLAPAEVVSQL